MDFNIEGLWVDDERPLPQQYAGWLIARSYKEAIDILSQISVRCVSLDHDLASFEDGKEKTGYDIALWLAERKFNGDQVPEQVWAHSANPVGADRINGVVKRYLT